MPNLSRPATASPATGDCSLDQHKVMPQSTDGCSPSLPLFLRRMIDLAQDSANNWLRLHEETTDPELRLICTQNAISALAEAQTIMEDL